MLLARYADLFPNYVWTDYMAAIDVMAAEVKVLRSELLDALGLATSLREIANAGRTSYRTDAEWDVWKKLCARLEALLLEVRGRHYAATLPGLAVAAIQSSRKPTRVCIPYNVAFREVLQFVTDGLKQAGEQWTDQARQDAVSTILIAAAKQGLLSLWERNPNA